MTRIKCTTPHGVEYATLALSNGRLVGWTRDITRARVFDSAEADQVARFHQLSIVIGEAIAFEEVAPRQHA